MLNCERERERERESQKLWACRISGDFRCPKYSLRRIHSRIVNIIIFILILPMHAYAMCTIML
jgi:hypothetical protein